jgi:hypothetical protein
VQAVLAAQADILGELLEGEESKQAPGLAVQDQDSMHLAPGADACHAYYYLFSHYACMFCVLDTRAVDVHATHYCSLQRLGEKNLLNVLIQDALHGLGFLAASAIYSVAPMSPPPTTRDTKIDVLPLTVCHVLCYHFSGPPGTLYCCRGADSVGGSWRVGWQG